MNTPKRMCVSCRERHEKNNLIRLSLSNENKIVVDNKKENSSRAIYVCKNDECISKLKKTKMFIRTFKIDVDDDFYENLKKSI